MMGKLGAIVRRLPIVAVCIVSLAARSGLAADLQMRAPARMPVPGVVYGWALQNASYFDVPAAAIYARTGVPISNNIYRVGLNYRFSWPIIGK